MNKVLFVFCLINHLKKPNPFKNLCLVRRNNINTLVYQEKEKEEVSAASKNIT